MWELTYILPFNNPVKGRAYTCVLACNFFISFMQTRNALSRKPSYIQHAWNSGWTVTMSGCPDSSEWLLNSAAFKETSPCRFNKPPVTLTPGSSWCEWESQLDINVKDYVSTGLIWFLLECSFSCCDFTHLLWPQCLIKLIPVLSSLIGIFSIYKMGGK